PEHSNVNRHVPGVYGHVDAALRQRGWRGSGRYNVLPINDGLIDHLDCLVTPTLGRGKLRALGLELGGMIVAEFGFLHIGLILHEVSEAQHDNSEGKADHNVGEKSKFHYPPPPALRPPPPALPVAAAGAAAPNAPPDSVARGLGVNRFSVTTSWTVICDSPGA